MNEGGPGATIKLMTPTIRSLWWSGVALLCACAAAPERAQAPAPSAAREAVLVRISEEGPEPARLEAAGKTWVIFSNDTSDRLISIVVEGAGLARPILAPGDARGLALPAAGELRYEVFGLFAAPVEGRVSAAAEAQ